MLTVLLT